MSWSFSNPGTRERLIRKPLLKDGKISVEVVGKEDLYDFIQSFADQCDIESIVLRAANGEPELLSRRSGTFGDFTVFPKTYAEVLQKVIDATSMFEGLSPDIRGRFDNDVYKFISSMDDADWLERAGFVTADNVPPVDEKESEEK